MLKPETNSKKPEPKMPFLEKKHPNNHTESTNQIKTNYGLPLRSIKESESKPRLKASLQSQTHSNFNRSSIEVQPLYLDTLDLEKEGMISLGFKETKSKVKPKKQIPTSEIYSQKIGKAFKISSKSTSATSSIYHSNNNAHRNTPDVFSILSDIKDLIAAEDFS